MEHGFTLFCPGCTALRAGTAARSHTDTCRGRIEGKLKESTSGQAQLERSEERINYRLAEKCEETATYEESNTGAAPSETGAGSSGRASARALGARGCRNGPEYHLHVDTHCGDRNV